MTSETKPRWMMYSFLSMLAWGLWAYLPKLALQSLTPDNVIFYESVGNLFPAIVIFIYLRGRIEFSRPGLATVCMSSFMTAGSILAYLYALKHGQVGVVVTLTGMYPVITILMAWAILKEKISRRQCFAIGLAMVAIYLLAS
jgi:transporter family protein